MCCIYYYRDWRDGSVSQGAFCTSIKALSSELNTRIETRDGVNSPVTQHCEKGVETGASLAVRFRVRPCFESIMQSNRARELMSSSGLHLCAQAHMCTYTYTVYHTCKHSHTLLVF